MRHVVSSIFNAVRGADTLPAAADHGVAHPACSSSMAVLTFKQLCHIVGGDDSAVDSLPKGGWKTTTTTA